MPWRWSLRIIFDTFSVLLFYLGGSLGTSSGIFFIRFSLYVLSCSLPRDVLWKMFDTFRYTFFFMELVSGHPLDMFDTSSILFFVVEVVSVLSLEDV